MIKSILCHLTFHIFGKKRSRDYYRETLVPKEKWCSICLGVIPVNRNYKGKNNAV